MKNYMYYGILCLEGNSPPPEYLRGHLHNPIDEDRRPRHAIVCAFRPFRTRADAHQVAKDFDVKLWNVQRGWLAPGDLATAQNRVFESVDAFRKFVDRYMTREGLQ